MTEGADLLSRPLYDALTAAVNILSQHPDLPEPLSVSMNQEGLWVDVWELGAPITALLKWYDALDNRSLEIAQSTDDYTTVHVSGMLDKYPMTVTATTYRDIHTKTRRLSVDDLRKVAREEKPYAHAP